MVAKNKTTDNNRGDGDENSGSSDSDENGGSGNGDEEWNNQQ